MRLFRLPRIAGVAVCAAFSLIALSAASPRAAHAQTVLAVDFGTDAPSPLETGFDAFSLNAGNNANASRTFGAFTVTLPQNLALNGPTSRDRGFTDGASPNLYRDLITALTLTSTNTGTGTAGTGATMFISGLAPSTTFQVELWSLDFNFNPTSIYSWYDTTNGTSTLLGTIANSNTVKPTSMNDYRVFNTVTSDATGNLSFGLLDSNFLATGARGALNGVRLSSVAVPEPSALALAGLGALPLLGVAARRRHK